MYFTKINFNYKYKFKVIKFDSYPKDAISSQF